MATDLVGHSAGDTVVGGGNRDIDRVVRLATKTRSGNHSAVWMLFRAAVSIFALRSLVVGDCLLRIVLLQHCRFAFGTNRQSVGTNEIQPQHPVGAPDGVLRPGTIEFWRIAIQ